MESKTKREIIVDGVVYVPKNNNIMAESIDGMPYKIIRTARAGVFAGYLKTRTGSETILINARRLWYWKGAASLSQLAMEGISCPNECKFPVVVSSVELLETIEVLDVTEKARKSIDGVPIWKV